MHEWSFISDLVTIRAREMQRTIVRPTWILHLYIFSILGKPLHKKLSSVHCPSIWALPVRVGEGRRGCKSLTNSVGHLLTLFVRIYMGWRGQKLFSSAQIDEPLFIRCFFPSYEGICTNPSTVPKIYSTNAMYITFIHVTLFAWVIMTRNWHLGKKWTILRPPKELAWQIIRP